MSGSVVVMDGSTIVLPVVGCVLLVVLRVVTELERDVERDVARSAVEEGWVDL